MKRIKISTFTLISLVLGVILTPTVYATSSILPEWILDLFEQLGVRGICATEYINSRVQFFMYLALGGLVLIAIIYALIASFKYIRSEGDPGEMEKAQKSIKAIFYGIGSLMVGIIGIVLVFVIFGAQPTNPSLYQVCLSAPASDGCKACLENVNNELCRACETNYELVCDKYEGDLGVEDTVLLGDIQEGCK